MASSMGRPMTGAVQVRTLHKCYGSFSASSAIFPEVEGTYIYCGVLFFLKDGAARPMTAVRAAGYSSSLTRGKRANYTFYCSS